LVRLWAAEGVGGFYKGNSANCLKVAPTKGIQFVSFEFFKRQILLYKRWRGEAEVLEPIERLVAGGFAGMVAAACVYPLETVKSLLTVERGRYGAGILDSLQGLVAEQGVLALYRGLVPTLIAMFPYVGVEFCTYESVRAMVSGERSDPAPSPPGARAGDSSGLHLESGAITDVSRDLHPLFERPSKRDDRASESGGTPRETPETLESSSDERPLESRGGAPLESL